MQHESGEVLHRAIRRPQGGESKEGLHHRGQKESHKNYLGIRVPNAAEDLHEIDTRDESVEGHGNDGNDGHRDDGPKIHEPDPRQLNVLAAGGFNHA